MRYSCVFLFPNVEVHITVANGHQVMKIYLSQIQVMPTHWVPRHGYGTLNGITAGLKETM
jgi:hypothetical protein